MSPQVARKRKHLLWGVYGSFLLCLLVAGVLVVNAFSTSRDRQIAACERGNVIRAEIDALGGAFKDAQVILAARLQSVARAQKEAGNDAGARKRLLAARRLMALKVTLNGQLDCEKVIREQ